VSETVWTSLLCRYIPSKYRREIRRLNGELEAVLTESIGRSREIADEGRTTSAYGRGLLAMLLAEMEKEKEKKAEQFSYDLQLVVDECKTFFFAGHDTSALLLTWALMLLATHPEWQDRARAEVARVCGDDPPSYDDLSKLTVVRPSVRPIVVALSRPVMFGIALSLTSSIRPCSACSCR
jgi:cytokinin trans-hydroxylase